jgi:hypothetical protein
MTVDGERSRIHYIWVSANRRGFMAGERYACARASEPAF